MPSGLENGHTMTLDQQPPVFEYHVNNDNVIVIVIETESITQVGTHKSVAGVYLGQTPLLILKMN